MKLTPGINFINILFEYYLPIIWRQKLQSWNVARESCAKHFPTKNRLVKCRWSWYQYFSTRNMVESNFPSAWACVHTYWNIVKQFFFSQKISLWSRYVDYFKVVLYFDFRNQNKTVCLYPLARVYGCLQMMTSCSS